MGRNGELVRVAGRTSLGTTLTSGGTQSEWFAGRYPWLYLFVVGGIRFVKRHLLELGAVVALVVLRLYAGSWLGTLLVLLAAVACLGLGAAGAAVAGYRPPSLASAREYLKARRRRWAAADKWPQFCAARGLVSTGGRAIPRGAIEATSTGVRFQCAPGQVDMTWADVQRESHYLAAGLMALSCRVTEGRIIPQRSLWDRLLRRHHEVDDLALGQLTPGLADVQIDWSPSLGAVYRVTDLPELVTDQTGVTRLVVGMDDKGRPVSIALGTSILVGGATGSGKSNLVWTMIDQLNRLGRERYRLRVIDPYQGVEMGYLDPAGDPPGLAHVYERNPGNADRVVKDQVSAMEARMRHMAERRVRVLTEPTVDDPADFLVVDEILRLGKLNKEGDGPLGQLCSAGRKALYMSVLLTQLGTIDVMERVRDLVDWRICFRTTTPEQTDAILGKGATSRGARCHEISRETERGVGYLASPDGTLIRFRTPLVAEEDARRIAQGLPAEGVEAPDVEAKEFWLYRWYGNDVDEETGEVRSDRRLLYVGESDQPVARMYEHIKARSGSDRDWTRHVRFSTVAGPFESKAGVVAAETQAINGLLPDRHPVALAMEVVAGEVPKFNVRQVARGTRRGRQEVGS